MRKKIALMIKEAHDEYPAYTPEHWVEYADKIISIISKKLLKGVMVEEECIAVDDTGSYPIEMSHISCSKCHGIGTITRQAELGDIDISGMITILKIITESLAGQTTRALATIALTTKSGGRLVIRE